ncbi:MAG: hypothetical protein KTR31_11115 [Myxococcales bacterium]|nr:hypothetical protein [Myxococcales bacterium]
MALLCGAGLGCSGGVELGRPAPERPDLVEPDLTTSESTVSLVHVAMDWSRHCTIDASGRAQCSEGVPPPGMALQDLSLAGDDACGLTREGRAECWGGPLSVGQVPAPDTSFDEMRAGNGFACGLRDAEVWCWGDLDPADRATFELASATMLRSGNSKVCALRSDGSVDCLSIFSHETWLPGPVEQLYDGPQGVVALTGGGELTRQGVAGPDTVRPEIVAPFAVALGRRGLCVLTPTSRVVCDYSLPAIPEEALALAGDDSPCAITLAGELTCW